MHECQRVRKYLKKHFNIKVKIRLKTIKNIEEIFEIELIFLSDRFTHFYTSFAELREGLWALSYPNY